uniref:Uncharacterized protein n=1 Tax=Trypanosoma congolense (strain IL3000) TaxID=1068625 RepID=G0USK6_TRYCI|nr:conserved hypothetical protein [Trypanosoma congolense IL3000]
MVWLWSSTKTKDGTVTREEAEKALAAIFSPSHTALKNGDPNGEELLHRPLEGGRLCTASEPGTAISPTPNVSVFSRAYWRGCGAAAPPKDNQLEQEKPIPLSAIPPCPIAGYSLGPHGLIDNIADPPRTLTIQDVRSLIAEMSSIEQRAKYEVDTQLPDQVHGRGQRGVELIINPCLYLCGLYLILWKTPRLYFGASPRGSALFTRTLKMLRWHLPEVEKERLARKYRRALQATNARVTLAFLTGIFVITVAATTHPPADVMNMGPDIDIGKQSVSFQHHSEMVLRWLWLVYYHHPAYKSLAKATCTPLALEDAGS